MQLLSKHFSLALTFTACLSVYLTEVQGQCMRQLVLQKYRDNYLANQVKPEELKWTGDSNNCTAGGISKIAETKTLKMINYFRELCGLPNAVEWDTAYNRKAQEAALMMRANNDLDHDPPVTWKCFSMSGKEAAGRSNLALGYHSTQAITAYMADYGESNYAVGHRRWILYPRAKYFGQGSTSSSQALYVIGRNGTDPKPDFVAYPAPGFFPKPLVYPRWSFSKDGADFSQAEITMQEATGQVIALFKLPLENGYGANTVVWEPAWPSTWPSDNLDRTILVALKGVKIGGQDQEFAYQVHLVSTQDQPQCAVGYAFNGCYCTPNITTAYHPDAPNFSPRIMGNPVKDVLVLENVPSATSGEIRTLAGQLVWSKTQLSQDPIPLDLPSGIYMLILYHGQQISQLPFVKL